MDQDSFRQLLQSGSATKPKTTTTGWGTSSKKPNKTKNAAEDAAKTAFKPRTVKKADNYRDRAAERRGGAAGDYAQVEALAEDFERRNADQDRKTLEEQRKYLGGDSTHTVLVKGLDFALLEQNKARAFATSTIEDDDTLEQAFIEGSSTVSKKRTREEIVAELRNKRTKGEATDVGEEGGEEGVKGAGDMALEEAKKSGKFKPIGFKPIGETEKKGKKKVIKKVKGEGKKKKAKEDVTREYAVMKSTVNPKVIDAKPPAPIATKLAEPEPESIDEDFDIFAGAGEYTGLDLGDDDGDAESETEPGVIADDAESMEPIIPQAKWFETEEEPSRSKSRSPPPSREAHRLPSQPPHGPGEPEEGEEPEEEPAMRLVPLSTSMSVRDILAADEEEEKAEKRRARKEKKKKGELSTAGKVDRDYQRLKAYQEKKGSGS
ncbi:RED-like protein N-terminal region-domain-containing protein [Irpex rosettiformis]|uniref:RED-like protein N-terminal region-domain-containing protein n=1 Tax=Irpex rosettiformis TaxID=378272 RepID=A0ACB8TPJ2_9APHY|nr:RED-like protein N-terminal region-domain-containing protein [Irpex rosettiformis]